MKVLVIGDHDRIIGGAERFLHELTLEAAGSPIQFSVLALNDFICHQHVSSSSWRSIRDRWLVDNDLHDKLVDRIRTACADLIHLNTNAWRTSTVFSVLRRVNTPVVDFVHDAWMLRRICMPGARLQFGRFQFMTHQPDYHASLKRCGFNSWLVRVPFRASHWTINADDLSKKFDLLYAGRVDREKGIHIMLDAVECLVARNPGIQVAIAGEGNASDWLCRQLRARHLEGNVFPLGQLRDAELAQLYRQAKLLVLPSAQESLGYVGLEAQSCGLPVVAFTNPGTRRWCIDRVSGFLVDRRTPAALAHRIGEVLDDESLRSRVAARALEGVHAGQYNASGLAVADAYRAILRPC